MEVPPVGGTTTPHATASPGSSPRAQPDSSDAHRLRQLAGCRAVPGEGQRHSTYLVEHGRVGCKGPGRDQREDSDIDQRKWPGSRKDAEGGRPRRFTTGSTGGRTVT